MTIYKPTWLYIKQHNQTGLKYFGITIQDPLKYIGSGSYWKSHLKIHGKDISTVWYCLFLSKEDLINCATLWSTLWNIVNEKDKTGKKSWANEKPETGIAGGAVKGRKLPPRSEEWKKQCLRVRLESSCHHGQKSQKKEVDSQ
jgi:hypothetical protein